MSIKNSNTILIAICCILLLFIFYSFNESQKIKQTQKSLADLLSTVQMKEDFYYHNFEMKYMMDGAHVSDITYLENHHKKKLSELVKEKPALIFVYKRSCSSCDNDEIKEFQKIFSENSGLAYILCSHQINRELYIYAQKNQIEIPIYGISSDSFNWVAEDYNKPYYFILHPCMKISHVYVPSKQYTELNTLYLKTVKQFLQTKQDEILPENIYSRYPLSRHSTHSCG